MNPTGSRDELQRIVADIIAIGNQMAKAPSESSHHFQRYKHRLESKMVELTAALSAHGGHEREVLQETLQRFLR